MDNKLGQLEGLRKTKNGYIGKCPAHDDDNPSLSIAETEDGKILLHCFAGCSTNEICKALGISLNQLFPDSEPTQERRRQILKYQRNIQKDFEEIRRLALLAMYEFKDLTETLQKEYTLDDMPEDLVWAIHKLPQIDWYLELLTTKTNEVQLELLREGVISKWAQLSQS